MSTAKQAAVDEKNSENISGNVSEKHQISEKHHYTYIVKCSDGSLYTGYTTDPEKRVKAHNSGKGAKYTRSRGPVELVYVEESQSKESAMRREYEIKQLTREAKLHLIRGAKQTVGNEDGNATRKT